jgi:hypothetical protein
MEVHVHAAYPCSCRMFILLVTVYPCCMFMLYVRDACPRCSYLLLVGVFRGRRSRRVVETSGLHVVGDFPSLLSAWLSSQPSTLTQIVEGLVYKQLYICLGSSSWLSFWSLSTFVHHACPFSMSILYANAACPCCMPMEHSCSMSTSLCCMSILLVYAASLLHVRVHVHAAVHSACPCCMSMNMLPKY